MLIDEFIRLLFLLAFASITGLVGYFWGRRRVREKDLFLLWRNAFDRPALRGAYTYHSDQEKFRRAIYTLQKSIATGKLFDTDGAILYGVDGIYYGPSQIRNPNRRKVIIQVRDGLEKILLLSRVQADQKFIDDERDGVVKQLNYVWRSMHIEEMPVPTSIKADEQIQALIKELEEEPSLNK